MGFEPGTGQLGEQQRLFIERIFLESGGYLKTIQWENINYLPVTCSHTAAATNLAEGGQPGLHPELCDDDGNISHQKLIGRCPSWSKAINEGFDVLVFRRELEVWIPELPSFLSNAGNQTHEVHQKETKIQLMMSLHQLYTSKKRQLEMRAEKEAKAPGTIRLCFSF